VSLHDLIKADATAVFCNGDDFAESVIYYPVGGGSRTIYAVVIRDTLAREDAGGILDVFQVHIANDATDGISSASLNLGGDYITLPRRDGKSPTSHTITQIIEQDEGVLVLECR
jgi:hypothetical protein